MLKVVWFLVLSLQIQSTALASSDVCRKYFKEISSNSAYVIPTQTLYERLSAAFQDLKRTVTFDKALSKRFIKREKEDRDTANRTIDKYKSKMGEGYFFLSDIVSSLQKEDPYVYVRMGSRNWEVDHLQIDAKNAPRLEALKRGYAEILDPVIYQILSQTLDKMNSRSEVRKWIIELREEVLRTMWEDGIRSLALYMNPRVRELYLDIVLSTRAVRNGFKIQENDLPYGVYTFSERAFFKVLSEGQLFLDWSGLTLSNTATGAIHGVRGHALVFAYLSETVPDFLGLIKYIGKTKDKDHIWKYFFDNAVAHKTPFYNTYWLDVYKEYLGIEY